MAGIFKFFGKFIHIILLVTLIIVFALFALDNQDKLELGLWPFKQKLALPLYLWFVALFVVGACYTYLISRFTVLSYRSKLSKSAKEIKKLKAEIEKIKPKDDLDLDEDL